MFADLFLFFSLSNVQQQYGETKVGYSCYSVGSLISNREFVNVILSSTMPGSIASLFFSLYFNTSIFLDGSKFVVFCGINRPDYKKEKGCVRSLCFFIY